jgi:hypothetical protein
MLPLQDLSNEELILALDRSVAAEITALIELLKHLAEFDRRKLWLELAYTSLFVYCTQELHFSEDEAARRIYAARAARDYPLIYQLVDQRQIHLSAVVKLAPHLTPENHRELLWSAAGRTRVEIEAIVACLAPKAPPRDVIRVLTAEAPRLAIRPASEEIPPGPVTAATAAEAPRPTRAAAPVPTSVRFSFCGSGDLLKNINRARDILRHKYPKAEIGEIVAEALEALLDAKDPMRLASRRERRRARAASPGNGIAPADETGAIRG